MELKQLVDLIGAIEFDVLVGVFVFLLLKPKGFFPIEITRRPMRSTALPGFRPTQWNDVDTGSLQLGAETLFPPIPLPEEVLAYCEEESEVFAATDCKSRARQKFTEDSGDWDVVLTSLQREDGIVK